MRETKPETTEGTNGEGGEMVGRPAKRVKLADIATILKKSRSLDQYSPNAEMDKKKKHKRSKVICDCIHGHIELPPAAVAIIDTKEFQRLRSLKQCGNCHLVFPNATHNRFQHSIGVGYVAGKFVSSLMERYPLWCDEKDVLCVQIAGLCHDLGHGPYSHLWEHFIKEADPESDYHHEDTSIIMLDHLLDSNNLRPVLKELGGINDQDILFIKEQIAGPIDQETGLPSRKKFDDNEPWPYRGRGEEKSFLYEIVANKINGIDVDKWDYFLRDDYYLKIGHVFDYQRFIKYCTVEPIGPTQRKRICLRDKEAENLLEMYKDRARLHRHGYQHRVALIADRMLLDAWLLANEFVSVSSPTSGEEFSLAKASQKDIGAHMKLTDEYIKFRVQESDHPKAQKARDILDRIETRDFYTDIYSIVITGNDQLKRMSTLEILEDIRSFIPDVVVDNDDQNDALNPQDLTVLRQNVTAGMKFDKIYFYNKEGHVTKADPNSFRKILHETSDKVYVCIKRPEVHSQASEVVKRWIEARDLEDIME